LVTVCELGIGFPKELCVVGRYGTAPWCQSFDLPWIAAACSQCWAFPGWVCHDNEVQSLQQTWIQHKLTTIAGHHFFHECPHHSNTCNPASFH
jgi:hypothetical protein